MPGLDHERAFREALDAVKLSSTEDEPLSIPGSLTPPKEPHGTTTAPVVAGGVTASNIWRHPDAHPIVLDLLLLRAYGPDWLLWEAETLQHLVPQDFKTQVFSDLNISKVQALKTLHLVDTYWQQWEVFLWCTMPFNAEFPNFEVMQIPTLAQCLVSIDIANRVRDDVQWSPEVSGYLEAVYRHDGVLLPLPPADFVHIDTDVVDVAELKKLSDEARVSGKIPQGDTVIDEQVRRVQIVNGFLNESRSRLSTQLELLHV